MTSISKNVKLELPSLKKIDIKKEEEEEKEEDEEELSNSDYENENENNEKEKSVSDKKLDPNSSFFATFIDGSSLRYLIEYLRLTATEGTFVLTKDYITYQKEDDDGVVLNDVRLKTYELTDYEFSSFNSEIVAKINLSDLRNKTRTVGKKEQLDFYKRAEEASNFYVQVRSQEKSSGDNPVFYCMPMKSENITIFELPIYERGKHNPNCTIYQSDFSKVCKALVANKCSYAEFIGFQKGIIIKGYSADGKIAMVKEYGKCRPVQNNKTSTSNSIINVSEKNKPHLSAPKLSVRDADEIERFKIHISNIKSLSKINGFSGTGTLKFYIESGLPMKISTSIGTFGKLNILIRSV